MKRRRENIDAWKTPTELRLKGIDLSPITKGLSPCFIQGSLSQHCTVIDLLGNRRHPSCFENSIIFFIENQNTAADTRINVIGLHTMSVGQYDLNRSV